MKPLDLGTRSQHEIRFLAGALIAELRGEAGAYLHRAADEGLRETHFDDPRLGRIYREMLGAIEDGEPVTLPDLGRRLQNGHSNGDANGLISTLAQLDEAAVTDALGVHDAELIRAAAERAERMDLHRRLARDLDDEQARVRLRELEESDGKVPRLVLSEAGLTGDRLREFRSKPEPHSPLPGLFDPMPSLHGLVAAAQTGKTTFVANLACAWATGEPPWEGAPALPGGRALLLSNEQGARQIWNRCRRMAGETEVASGEVACKRYRRWEDRIVIVGKENKLARRLRRFDRVGLTGLRRALTHAREVERDPFTFVAYDSLQRLKPPEPDSNSNDDVASLLDELLQIAIDLEHWSVIVHHAGHAEREAPSRAGRGATAFGDVTVAQWLLKRPDPWHREIRVEGNDVLRGCFRFRVGDESRPDSIQYWRLEEDDGAADADDLRDHVQAGETCTQSEIARRLRGLEAGRRPGRSDQNRALRAIDRGVREGFLEPGKGPRGANTVRRIA